MIYTYTHRYIYIYKPCLVDSLGLNFSNTNMYQTCIDISYRTLKDFIAELERERQPPELVQSSV